MTRLSPSVLLTPDPEGMLYDEDEVNKRVKEEREACAAAVESLFPRIHTYSSENSDRYRTQDETVRLAVNAIRSRNEESK